MIFHALDFLKKSGCLIRNRFHIYCPGCGGTRAVEALLRLQLEQSLYYNPVVILLIIVTVCIVIIRFIESKSGKKHKERMLVYVLFLVLWFTFFVARNVLLLYYGIDMLRDFK